MALLHPHDRRRVGTIAIAAAVAALAITGTPPTATATATFAFKRFAGTNRYDTAAQIATKSFKAAGTVLLATGEAFPDALAGNYLAGTSKVPILLTQKDQLPPETSDALTKLAVKSVTILGGPSAVSASVEAALTAKGLKTSRVAGADRYETALAAAQQPGPSGVGSVGGQKTAILASGANFPDALAGGPMSFRSHLPTFLTKPDTLSPQAKTGFQSLGIQQVLILGGPGAVSNNVETQVAATGVTTKRLAGADRTATAAAIAQYAISTLSFPTTHVDLSRGDDFPDALAGGAHAGTEGAPILLSINPTLLDGPTHANATFLSANRSTLTDGDIFGGTGAVSDAVAAAAARAAGSNPPNAPAGTSTPTIADVDLANDVFFSTNDASYHYDSGDTFAYRGATKTMSEFESIINQDDSLTVDYAPGGTSTFNITNDAVHQVQAPGVQVINNHKDVLVTVRFPANNSAGTAYEIQRAEAVLPNCSAPMKPYSDMRQATPGTATYVDPDPSASTSGNGCFTYRVNATTTATGVEVDGKDSAKVAFPDSASSGTAVTITRVQATGDTDGKVDANDKHVFEFSTVMDPSTGGGSTSYTLSDQFGHTATVTCGTTATCALMPFVPDPPSPPDGTGGAHSELTVTITAASAVGYPATILAVAGMKDTNGTAVDVTKSDTYIETTA
ncbi:MAG: hypothetical protein JWO37_1816 [Acidimicrobiales bacterium]|nr:hypothetical protein [Acidimicrobiales bacterium]